MCLIGVRFYFHPLYFHLSKGSSPVWFKKCPSLEEAYCKHHKTEAVIDAQDGMLSSEVVIVVLLNRPGDIEVPHCVSLDSDRASRQD